MRGLIVRPAGVPVLIVFEDDSPQLWEETVRAWGALEPECMEDAGGQVADFERVTVVSRRSFEQVAADFPQVADFTVVNSLDAALAAERLTVEVTMHLLRALVGSSYLLHAAVLGDAQSRGAFALVARSGAGKTTAARFLGQHFTYLTDETAVVGTDFSVRPYAKPLSVIEDESRPKVQHNPVSLGLQVAAPRDASYTLKRLMILNRVKGQQGKPVMEPVPLASALLEVVEQSSGMKLLERGLESMALLLNGVGGAVRLTYSEITDVLPLVRDLMQRAYSGQGGSEDFTYVAAEPVAALSEFSGSYARADDSEGIRVGNRCLISAGERISEVSMYAWDCWQSLAQPLGEEQLYRTMQGLYGEIPLQDFKASLGQLKEVGLLRQLGASQ